MYYVVFLFNCVENLHVTPCATYTEVYTFILEDDCVEYVTLCVSKINILEENCDDALLRKSIFFFFLSNKTMIKQ